MRSIQVIALIWLAFAFILEKVNSVNSPKKVDSQSSLAQTSTELNNIDQLTASLSQAALFVRKIEEFFDLKCKKSEFYTRKDYSRAFDKNVLYPYGFDPGEIENRWMNNLYNKYLATFKIEDLHSFFKVSTKNDQTISQQEDSEEHKKIKESSTSLFEQVEAEIMQLLCSILAKINSGKATDIAENGMKNLSQRQNMIIFFELLETSKKMVKIMLIQLKDTENKENRMETFGDDGSLIRLDYYEELIWKFDKINEIIAQNSSILTMIISWSSNSANLNVKWIEGKETILAWVLEDPIMNEIRFVKTFNDYFRWEKTTRFLENGPDDFFTYIQKQIIVWKIVFPNAFDKLKEEIQNKISYFIDHYGMVFKQKDARNRLFLLIIMRVSMDFNQNAKNKGILEKKKAKKKNKKFQLKFKRNLNEDEMFEKLNTFSAKGSETCNFYYEKKTGENLKKLMESYQSGQQKEQLVDEYVSLKQLGEDEKKRGKYVQTKVLQAFGELLRQGASLALLDWLKTNHKKISMTELTYLVGKLLELLFGEDKLNESENMGKESFQLYLIQFEEKLHGMTYAQLMEWFKNDAVNFDEESIKFFDNFFNFFEIAAKSFVGISEHQRKLLFCYELLQATTVLCQKSLDGFKQTPHEKKKNAQSQFLNQEFYNTMVKLFNDVCSVIKTKITPNTRIKIYEHIPADFEFEEKISRTCQMIVKTPQHNIAKILETIDSFITTKCAKSFWHLNDTEETEEITKCAQQFDFNQLFDLLKEQSTGFDHPQPFILFNLLVSVLHCEHQQALEKSVQTWICPFTSDLLPQIVSDGKNKFAILNGFLQFGRLFNIFFNTYMISSIDNKLALQWKNIRFPLLNSADDLNSVKNSFTTGQLKQMFSNSGGNMVAVKTVYISLKNIYELLETIGSFILSYCGNHLWHLADTEESEEVKNCSTKLDFGNLWTTIENPIYKDKLILLNMIAHVSISKRTTGTETWTSAFHLPILPQILADSEMKFGILQGLLKFGSYFNRIYGYWIVKASSIPEKASKNQWNNITIHISEIPSKEWDTIKKSLLSGQLKQIFSNNIVNEAAEKIVFLLTKK